MRREDVMASCLIGRVATRIRTIVGAAVGFLPKPIGRSIAKCVGNALARAWGTALESAGVGGRKESAGAPGEARAAGGSHHRATGAPRDAEGGGAGGFFSLPVQADETTRVAQDGAASPSRQSQ
jgi:hypothetical protein